MKPIVRTACAHWQGRSQSGSGAMTTESGILEQARYIFPFQNGAGTNPAELIAAAQAGSFSLALSNELGLAGFVPGNLVTTVSLTLESLPAGWTITNIHLDVIATVPKATQGDFIDATVHAKESCLILRLLRAHISMNAKLEK